MRATTQMLGLCALGLTATSVQAQTSPPAQQTQARSLDDKEVRQFTAAAITVQKVQQDSSIAAADKQTKIVAALQQSGLSPQRFNAIAEASNQDPALMRRIQTAAATMGVEAKPAR